MSSCVASENSHENPEEKVTFEIYDLIESQGLMNDEGLSKKYEY